MIPIKTEEELIYHCNRNVCGNCSIETICDVKGKLYSSKAHTKAVLEMIVIENRKEKLEKLLS